MATGRKLRAIIVFVSLLCAAAMAPSAQAAVGGALSALPEPDGCIAEQPIANECGDVHGLDHPGGLAVSPDGKNVYAVGRNDWYGALTAFRRDATTGALETLDDAGTGGIDEGCYAYVSADVTGCRLADGLVDPVAVTVSPDGLTVYVGSYNYSAIVAFDRDPADGSLTWASCVSDYHFSGGENCAHQSLVAGVLDLAISKDGNQLYAVGRYDDAVGIFDIDRSAGATHGDLTPRTGIDACWSHSGSGGTCRDGRSLDGPEHLTFSPLGDTLYVSAVDNDGIAIFSRAADGSLTQADEEEGCVRADGAERCYDARRIADPRTMAVSPDGDDLYVATGGDGVGVFERDAVTGALRQPAGRDGCWTYHDAGLDCKRQQSLVETSGIALSPQGESLYAGGNYDNAVTSFERRHGRLRMLPGREACVSQTGALPNYFGDYASQGTCGQALAVDQDFGTSQLVLSPDGENLYVAGASDNAIAVFAREPGRTDAAADRMTWDLSEDWGRTTAEMSNPQGDRYGNADVWRYASWAGAADGTGRTPASYQLLTQEATNSTSAIRRQGDGSWPILENYNESWASTHPDNGEASVFGWRNATGQTITANVAGMVNPRDRWCSDGISWYLDHDGSNLRGGYIPGGEPYAPAEHFDFDEPNVEPGDIIWLVIAQAGGTSCDSTDVDLRITGAVDGGPQTYFGGGSARGLINTTTPSFKLKSNIAVPSNGFECRVDGGAWNGCPATFVPTLGQGDHTIEARAKDMGVVDPSPVKRSITVDTIAPTVAITSGPSGSTRNSSPSFSFTASEAGSRLYCSFDNSPFDRCDAPKAYDDLSPGAHHFEVKAADRAGNMGTATAREFTVITGAAGLEPGALAQLPGANGCLAQDPNYIQSLFGDTCAASRGMHTALEAAVSPDDKTVYVTGIDLGTLTVFDRAADGSLTQKAGEAGCLEVSSYFDECVHYQPGLGGASGVVVSHDGEQVYVAGYHEDAVAIFDRDTTPGATLGALTYQGCVSQSGAGGCTQVAALDAAASLVISPDDEQLYVATEGSDSIVVLDRDGTTGALTQPAGLDGCWSNDGTGGQCRNGRAMANMIDLDITDDGSHVYGMSTAGEVSVFKRSAAGTLTQLGGEDGCVNENGAEDCYDGRALGGGRSIDVSPDEANVYVGYNDGIGVFDVRAGNGLQQSSGRDGCIYYAGNGTCTNSAFTDETMGLVVAPDGRNVYANNFWEDSIVSFRRDADGDLTRISGPDGCSHNTGASGECRDGRGIGTYYGNAITLSHDGRSVYMPGREYSGTLGIWERNLPTSADEPQAMEWDALADFQSTDPGANPGGDRYGNAGVWRYMSAAADGEGTTRDYTTYTDLTEWSASPRNEKRAGWFEAGATGGWAGVGPNDDWEWLHMHPDDAATGGESVVTRWRNPLPGNTTFNISVQLYDEYRGGDGVTWYLDRGMETLASGVLPTSGDASQSAEASVELAENETIDLVLSPRGGFDNDSTLVKFHVVGGEEPGPQTTITAGPRVITNDATPAFSFTGGPDFECRWDGGGWDPCATGTEPSPALSDASHSFEVRSKDGADVDITPVKRTFTVDTVAPTTNLVSGPPNTTTEAGPTFTFTRSEAGVTECRLDSADASAWESCSSPYKLPEQDDGIHTLELRSRDRAGNVGPAISSTFKIATGGAALQPGAIAQLPGLKGCIAQDTPVGGEDCTDGRGVATPTAGAISGDGQLLYVTSWEDSALTINRRSAGGGLTQIDGAAGCESNDGGECTDVRAMYHPYAVATYGDNVYTAQLDDHSVAVFKRNGDDTLSQLDGDKGCVRNESTYEDCASGVGLYGPAGIAVSPDGTTVYVASYYGSMVAVFDRDPVDGSLTQLSGKDACWSQDGSGGTCHDGRALANVHRVIVAPDGENVYAASVGSSAVVSFARDTATGALRQLDGEAGCIREGSSAEGCAPGNALSSTEALAISPDGANVYAAGAGNYAIAVLRREPDGGLSQEKPLGPLSCIQNDPGACRDTWGLTWVSAIVVSPDGRNVYAASDNDNAVTSFTREQDGSLTALSGPDRCWTSDGTNGYCRNGKALDHGYGSGIVMSADGANLYTFNEQSRSIAAFDRREPATGGAPLEVWDLRDDFRLSPDDANPQPDRYDRAGVWTFAKFDGDGTGADRTPASYVALPTYDNGLPGWRDDYDGAGDTLPYVSRGSERTHSHPGGGPLLESTVIGWTNPTGGPLTVDVSANVSDTHGGCGDGIQWALDNDTTPIGSGAIPDGGGSRQVDSTEEVPAGGSIWLVVSPGASHSCDSTAHDLTITGVAESGPQTQITAGPKTTTSDPSPEFSFTGGPDFECRVDRTGGFDACLSGAALSTLADGFHTFEVRSKNGADVDGSPALRRFKVDATAPDVVVESGPDGVTRDRTPTWQFELAQSEPAVFECRLDSTAVSGWKPCTSPYTAPELVAGAHKLEIRATDRALNADATPAVLDFVVDTLASGLQFGGLAQLGSTDGCVSDTGSEGACADGTGLDGASSSVVSPDGNFVYVASVNSDTVTVFSRSASGKLTQLAGVDGCVSQWGDDTTCAAARGIDRPEEIALSDDGAFLYVAGRDSNSIAAFSRDAATGRLTQLDGVDGCVSNYGDDITCADVRALYRPWSLEVAGDTLYSVNYDDSSVATFTIEPDGGLTQLAGADGCLRWGSTYEDCRSTRYMGAPLDLEVVGGTAYISSAYDSAIVVVDRDAGGALTQRSGTDGCVRWVGSPVADCTTGREIGTPYQMVASPDGENLYVADEYRDGIAIFSIGAGGGLTQSTTAGGCWSENGNGSGGTADDYCENGRGMINASGIAIAPDGKTVYLAAPYGDDDGEGAVAVFRRSPSSGALQQLSGVDACWSNTGRNNTCRDGKALSMHHSHAVTVSPDNAHVYVSSGDSDGVAAFARRIPRADHLPQILEWDAGEDFTPVLANAANPSSDRYDQAGVWTYMKGNGGSTGSTRSSAGYEPFVDKSGDSAYPVAWSHTAADGASLPWVALDAQRRVRVHPRADAPAVLRWTYQHAESMAVEVSALVVDADGNGGDGVRWYLDHNGDRQASGRVYNGGRSDAAERTINVEQGDTIELVVAANADQDYDTTRVDFKVTGSPIADTDFTASSPEGLISDSSPQFGAVSTEEGAAFQCRYSVVGTVAPAFVPCDATWTIGPLADNEYKVEVVGTGDTSPAVRFIKVDATAPGVTVADMNGTALSAGTTADTKLTAPAFAGAAGGNDGTLATSSLDGDTITVRVWSGTDTGVAPLRSWTTTRGAAAWGPSAVQGGALAPGTYTVRAVQTDAAGNTGTSPARTFKVDTTAPSVAITKPSASPNHNTNDATPLIEGTAGTADGTAPAVSLDAGTVTVKVWAGPAVTGGAPVQTFSAPRAADGSWSGSVPVALPEGTYTARAEQTDGATNVGLSNDRTFKVDLTAPTVVMSEASTGDTNDSTPRFAGTMGQATGTDPMESPDDNTLKVFLYEGTDTTGTLARTLTATRDAGANTWAVSVAAGQELADGTYTAQAEQKDAAGNSGGSVTYTFKVDTTAPEPTVTSPPADTNDQTPTIDGVAGHEDGSHPARVADAAALTVRVLNADGSERFTIPATAAAGTGAYSVDVPAGEALPEGTYKIEVLQSDAVDNDGASDQRTFKVDVTQPATLTVATPVEGAELEDRRPAFSGTASTEDGTHVQRSADAPAVTVDVWPASADPDVDAPLATATGARSGAAYTATLPVGVSLADGRYVAIAKQFDLAGNRRASSTLHFKVDNIAPAPTIAMQGGRFDWDETLPVFTGVAGINSAADTQSVDLPTVTVKVYAGTTATGPVVAGGTATRDAVTGAYTVTNLSPAPAPGRYTATAEQSDGAGNVGVSAAPVGFKVDTTDPLPSVATPTEKQPFKDGDPTFSGGKGDSAGTANDESLDSDTLRVEVFDGGVRVRDLTVTQDGAAWSKQITPALSEGYYAVTVTQADAAGNARTTTARHFKVDGDDPAPAVTTPAAGLDTNDATPALAGTAETDDGQGADSHSASAGTVDVDLYAIGAGGTRTHLDLPALHGITRTAGGAWSTNAPALSDGTYEVEVTQTDASGRTGTSAARRFKVDTQAPAVTLLSPDPETNQGNPITATVQAGTEDGAGLDASEDLAAVTIDVFRGDGTGGENVGHADRTTTGGAEFDVDLPDLDEGTYTVRVIQSDAAGNSSADATKKFRVDRTDPVVALDGPATETGDATPAITGDAGSQTGSDEAKSPDEDVVVQVFNKGGAQVGADLEATPAAGRFTIDAPTLTSGVYEAKASQADAAGNDSGLQTREFEVDLEGSTVAIDANPDVRNAAQATPAITGTAGDATGAADGQVADGATVYVVLKQGATVIDAQNVSRGGDTTWAYTAPSALASGTYTIEASQTDAVGNASNFATDTFKVDAVAPVPTISTPVEGAALSDTTPQVDGAAGVTADSATATADAATVDVLVWAGGTAGDEADATLLAGVPRDAGTGNYAKELESALTAGEYTVRVRQADAAGNVGRSAARHFEIDTTTPNLTLGVTSPTNAVVFSGTAGTVSGAAAGESADGTSVAIRVYEGTDLVATLAADASTGTYAKSWTAPHDGTYTAEAEQADAAGNTMVTAPRVTVLVDTQAPAVTVAAPAAAVKGPRPVVSGTAGEHAADDDVVHVVVKQGATVVDAYDAPVSSGAYSKATTVDLADGNYTVEVTQQDAAGNTSAVASRAFSVDHVAPTVTVTTPATLVNGARPSIGGTAGTAASDLGTVSVTLTRNSSQVGGVLSGTVTGGGSWSVTPASDLASGTYTADAVQSDQAGNVSATATRVFKVDRSSPALALDVTSPTKLRRPVFSGTRGVAVDAEDNSADIAAVTGRVLDGTTEVATFTGSGTGAIWSGTPDADLADGTYTVEVVQSDTAGNTTTQTAPLTVDATAPSLTLSGPGAATGDTTPDVTGTAGTLAGDAGTVTIAIPGVTPYTAAVHPATGAFSGTVPETLGEGSHTATVTQTDAAGNETSKQRTFRVDTAAPAVTVTQPASLVKSSTPEIAGTAGDATGDDATVTVKLYEGTATSGTAVQTLQATRSTTSWTVTPASLADGTYTAVATQGDDAGNLSTIAQRTFTVDGTAPVVTVTAPGATTDATPLVEGVAASGATDADSVSITVKQGSTTVSTFTAAVGAGGAYSAPVPDALPAEATYDVTVEQGDDAGNTGTAQRSFRYDTTAPSVTLTAPAPSSRMADATPTFSGTAGNAAGDANTVTVRVYTGTGTTGTPVTLAAPRSGTSWSVDATPALASGTYTVTATQADDAGNSTTTASRTFVVDTAAPAVTLVTPAADSSSTDTTPTFSGAAGTAEGDLSAVRVKVYAGAVAAGTPVRTLDTTATAGSWTVDAAPALPVGVYTAQAEQGDSAGNTGLSGTRTFNVAAEQVVDPPAGNDPPPAGDTTPPVTTPPADTQAPGAAFGAMKTGTFLVKGFLALAFTLDEGADVTGELLVSAKDAKKLKLTGAKTSAASKYVRLGQAHKVLPSGKQTLKIKTSAKVRTRLKKVKKLKLTLRLTVFDTAFNKRVVTKAVTVKRP